MTTEDRLRDALAARAAVVDPRPAVATYLDRVVHRSSRTRLRLAAGTVALALVAAGTTALVLQGNGDRSELTPVSPAPSAEKTASAEPSSAAPVPHDAAVAVLADGRIVLLSGDTGEELFALGTTTVTRADGLPYSDGVAMSPDRQHVYITEPATFCAPTIVEIDTATGSRRSLGVGGRPAVSPDGRRLAVIATTGCNGSGVRVIDLASGAERVITPTLDGVDPADFFERAAVVLDLAWTDDDHIALVRHYEGPVATLTVDLTDPDDSPALPGRAVNADELASHPDGGFVAAFECCFPEHDRFEIQRISSDGGIASRAVLPAVASALAVDERGDALFRVGLDRLYRWDGVAPPRELRSDVLAVAW